jgi:hypothetical protein
MRGCRMSWWVVGRGTRERVLRGGPTKMAKLETTSKCRQHDCAKREVKAISKRTTAVEIEIEAQRWQQE